MLAARRRFGTHAARGRCSDADTRVSIPRLRAVKTVLDAFVPARVCLVRERLTTTAVFTRIADVAAAATAAARRRHLSAGRRPARRATRLQTEKWALWRQPTHTDAGRRRASGTQTGNNDNGTNQPPAPTSHRHQPATGTNQPPAPTSHRHQHATGTNQPPAPTSHRHQPATGTNQPPAPTSHRHQPATGTNQPPAPTSHRHQ